MNFIAVFLGGGIGSLIRYGIGIGMKNTGVHFPLGTLISNIIACLVLGLIVGVYQSKFAMHQQWWLFLSVGVCGGLSTFSTFGLENAVLIRNGYWLYLILNITISLLAGIGLIWYLLRFHELKS